MKKHLRSFGTFVSVPNHRFSTSRCQTPLLMVSSSFFFLSDADTEKVITFTKSDLPKYGLRLISLLGVVLRYNHVRIISLFESFSTSCFVVLSGFLFIYSHLLLKGRERGG